MTTWKHIASPKRQINKSIINSLRITVFSATLFLASSVNADITIRQHNSIIYYAQIVNKITPSDYETLVKKIDEIRVQPSKSIVIYELDSQGGDINTALKIGRYLRKNQALAKIPKNAVCLSSCIFIFAGATSRGNYGLAGIHRPYEPNNLITTASAQKRKYEELGRQIRTYLAEMNIPTRLYDDMLYIKPENVRILSNQDLASYGLADDDPFQNEADAASRAITLGISRQEYAKRRARIRNECPKLTDEPTYEEGKEWAICADAIESGQK